MKKLSRSKVQRMRNLVSGKYGDKTSTSTGYKSFNKKRKEGDVWEENGKTWTIKNGIKQNKTRLKKAKQFLKVPLACPKCGTSMNHPAHKKIFRIHGHCLMCQTKFETKLMVKNEYKLWLEKEVRKNFASWESEKKEQFNIWFDELESEKYITEAGQVESWSKISDESKQNLVSEYEKWIAEEKELKEKIIKENNDEYNK